MVGVEVRNNNVEKALKVFGRRVRKTGILREYKDRMYFTPDSEERRKARQEAEKKAKRHGNSPRA
jgi:ribosomal protein S21